MGSESRLPQPAAPPRVMLSTPGPGLEKLKALLQILISGFGGFFFQRLQIVNKTFCDLQGYSAFGKKIPELWYLNRSLTQLFLEISDRLP